MELITKPNNTTIIKRKENQKKIYIMYHEKIYMYHEQKRTHIVMTDLSQSWPTCLNQVDVVERLLTNFSARPQLGN